MKWIYNAKLGCFERKDKKGKKLWVTMSEAQRIVTLRNLGNSVGEIQAKMTFSSSKASSYSVKTVLEKFDDGSLIIDMDVPASDIQFNDLSIENKIDNLEMRISKIEDFLSEYDNKEDTLDKVKSWLRL